jgi:hypothetical protein
MNRTNIIALFVCARFCSLKFAVIHVTKFNVLHASVQKGWGVEMKLFGCAVREERSHNMPHRYTVAVLLCCVWLCSAFWWEIQRTNVSSLNMAKHILLTIKFANFDIRGIVHYEFVPTGQSTTFTSWKYWKCCVKKLDGNDPNFCQQLTCSHGIVCGGVFSY